MWSTTPVTSNIVYSPIRGSLSCGVIWWVRATRSARMFLGSAPFRSASKRTSRARRRALLLVATSAVDPAEVLAVAGVHLDLLAGGDEQRHLDLRAGLHGRGLGATGGTVALQAGLGVGDHHLDGGRQLDVERHPFVRRDHGLGALQQEV